MAVSAVLAVHDLGKMTVQGAPDAFGSHAELSGNWATLADRGIMRLYVMLYCSSLDNQHGGRSGSFADIC